MVTVGGVKVAVLVSVDLEGWHVMYGIFCFAEVCKSLVS